MATRPVSRWRFTTASPSASESHKGISTCTCLPASRHCNVCEACICVGVARMTASSPSTARLSARSVVAWPMPYRSATSCVLGSSRPTSETTSTSSMRRSASRCLMPNAPAPASAIFIVETVQAVVASSEAMDGSPRTNVVLTGFMGTGKTTVGHLLAGLLDYEFVDTDQLIVARHGPIPEIFRDRGEQEFRRIERELAAELAGGTPRVISTGGRMMLDGPSADALGRDAHVFCLVASAEAIAARVRAETSVERPLLAGDDPERRIAELLAERAEGYAQFEQI